MSAISRPPKKPRKHVRLSNGDDSSACACGAAAPTYITPIPGRVLYDVTDLDAWMWSRRRNSTSEAAAV